MAIDVLSTTGDSHHKSRLRQRLTLHSRSKFGRPVDLIVCTIGGFTPVPQE